LRKYEIGALVIAPTRCGDPFVLLRPLLIHLLSLRELASQIFAVFVKLSSSYQKLICALFVGGTDINDTYTDLEQNGAQVEDTSLLISLSLSL
jgi:hypothetical protein